MGDPRECFTFFSSGKFFSGSHSNDKRYRMEMLGSYGAPLIISVLTAIVETTAERCSDIRPRFGEESCFFASMYLKKSSHSKIWFCE